MRPLTDEQRTQIMHYFPPRLGKFVVPEAGILDAPFYCLIINVEWIGHLIGVLDALDQGDAWVGTSEEIEFARQEVRRLVTAINPCEESNFVLRQNPEDSCQLQQSLDGGVNWSLAFDYGLCPTQPSSSEILAQMALGASGLQALRDLWDGTPESILQGTESSPNLEDLLCYAIDMMVRSGCQTAADTAGDVNTLTNIVGVGLGVVAAGLAFFTGGASIAVWVGVMSAIVAAGGGLASLTKETLQDAGAQDDLICCINEALQGSDLSQATFSASVDGCDFPVDSNAFLLAQAFQTFTDNEDMYLAFLNFMHETDPFFQAGLYTCPCQPEYEWCWFVDGNDPAWVAVVSTSPTAPLATYDSTNHYWVGKAVPTANASKVGRIKFTFAHSYESIIVESHADVKISRSSGTGAPLRILTNTDQQIGGFGSHTPTGTRTITGTHTLTDTNNVEIQWSATTNSSGESESTSYARLPFVKITVSGGSNPFPGESNCE